MKAVVRRAGKLFCEDVAEPVPGPGQVLVRTLSCGICGSDLHALDHAEHRVAVAARAGAPASMDPAYDVVFGHEFCGEVLDYGPGAERRLKPGTRVVSIPFARGPSGAAELVGFSNRFPGGFGERMVLTESLLLPAPAHLTSAEAAMTEPFAVGIHVANRSEADAECVCLVVGCGPVGLAVIAALKARGLGPVVAADFSPARRRMAERFGADLIVDPAVESPHASWAALGAGVAQDPILGLQPRGKRPVVFECVGAPGVLQGVLNGVPRGARIVAAGACMETDAIEPIVGLVKEVDVRFAVSYTQAEFAESLAAIASGAIDAGAMITGSVGLDGVNEAFEALRNPERQVKVMVEPARGG